MMNTMTMEKPMFSADDYERKTGIRTLTEEDDTAEDVGRHAEDEDEGVEIAEEDVVHGGVGLKGDDVIGVVPRNKLVIVFAVTVVYLDISN